MTGQTSSNEQGVESSGFVTTEFSDYREKKNSVRRGRGSRGTDVNYKDKVIWVDKRNGEKRNNRSNLLFVKACRFKFTYSDTHAQMAGRFLKVLHTFF